MWSLVLFLFRRKSLVRVGKLSHRMPVKIVKLVLYFGIFKEGRKAQEMGWASPFI